MFREIKDAFDPLGQLNPGKVIGDDPHLMLRSLKSWHTAPVPIEPEAEPPAAASWGSGEIPAAGVSQAVPADPTEQVAPREQALFSADARD